MSVKKLRRNYILVVILAVFIVFIIALLYGKKPDMMQLDGPIAFNDGWSIETDESRNVVVFSREISEDMSGRAVGFYVYDSFVDAAVDGKAVYHFGEIHKLLKSPGSLWHLITIPADAQGQTLTISIQYVYNHKFTQDVDIILGSSGALILALLKNEIPDIVVNLAVLALGAILCAISLLQMKNKMNYGSSLYLGLLSVCFAFWCFDNLFLNQLLFPYGAAQYFLYYFSLFLLPLLFMCYLETITETLKFTWLFWLHIILGLVMSILQLTGISEFTETLSLFLGFSGVEMVIVIVRLLRDRGSHGNRRLEKAFVVMLICILINAVFYFFSPVKGVRTTVAKLGIIFYLLIVIYDSLGKIIIDLAEAKQSKILRKIAFTDSLTGVGNRYAFNYEISSIPLNRLSLFSLDINNLKYYNDTFGHACGDTLICQAVKILSQVFDNLFRTGGDEFIAVETARTAEELKMMKNKLESLMQEYNMKEPDVLVEIACGYSSCREGDISYEDILRRADGEMYQNKAALKKVSKIQSLR
ncbi:MAG: GGDEF domain-containing protein [Lachnospiraceae bacterium]|nr:GGDEF domain-containing protein [Lachnospiraceae bacterium]